MDKGGGYVSIADGKGDILMKPMMDYGSLARRGAYLISEQGNLALKYNIIIDVTDMDS